MRAARIVEQGKPLEIVELDDPKTIKCQVIVSIKSSGICSTDIHLRDGGVDLGDGAFMKLTDLGIKYPFVPGHEIAGVIDEIGEHVKGYSVGDKVLVYPFVGCGVCFTCKNGNENICDKPQIIGVWHDGGYADKILVPHYRHLVKIKGLEFDEATSLACAGLTSYYALKQINLKSEYIVMIGVGGLGMMGIQIAKILTNAKIICIDVDDDKLKAAKDMGADFVYNVNDSKVINEIISFCDNKGANVVIDYVGIPSSTNIGLSVLRSHGHLVLIGLFGGSMSLSLPIVAIKALTIQGVTTGNYNDLVELVELAEKGLINPVISKKYSLDQVNDALKDLEDRKIIARAVINP